MQIDEPLGLILKSYVQFIYALKTLVRLVLTFVIALGHLCRKNALSIEPTPYCLH